MLEYATPTAVAPPVDVTADVVVSVGVDDPFRSYSNAEVQFAVQRPRTLGARLECYLFAVIND